MADFWGKMNKEKIMLILAFVNIVGNRIFFAAV